MSKSKKPEPGLQAYFYRVTGKIVTREEARKVQKEWIDKNVSEGYNIDMSEFNPGIDAIHPSLK